MLEAYIIERVRKNEQPEKQRPSLRIGEQQTHYPIENESVDKQNYRGIEVIDFTI